MSRSFKQFVRFDKLDEPRRMVPDFSMKWRNGAWKLEVELIDVEPKTIASCARPYNFVAKTEKRRDRMNKLLDAIETTHPADARMVLAASLDKLLWQPPAVSEPSVLEDKNWRAGNVTHGTKRWTRISSNDLWDKQGTVAEESVRTQLIYRIFNSLSRESKTKIVTAFMSLP